MVSSGYFLDVMTEWEALEMLSNLDVANRQDWERTRLQLYATAQANSTKKLKLEDIMQFAWEKKSEEDKVKEISNNDIKRIQERAQYIKEKFINGK